MSKFKLISFLTIPITTLVTISCSKKEDFNSKNVEFETNQNQKKSIFNQIIKKEALELKRMMRFFNYSYYSFYKNYDIVQTSIKELIEEQSLSENKKNLEKYYNDFWTEKSGNTFSKLLFEFKSFFEQAIDSLSNLNFYLENFKFDNEAMLNKKENEFKNELKNDFKQYIYNENLILNNDDTLASPPLKNIMNLLKNILSQISLEINKNQHNEFLIKYQEAKNYIYDNINRINLDNNILDLVNSLSENNKKDFFSFQTKKL
ncbi:hypothetical protein [Metamycoplasma canadense]|uniref:Lipoprotein n=1 Tax=Metamycoplasma canadense TaxID=29554 RepID=A0A077L602_9BACT|nr:hypothetical protein [Metamycoplasma canadense]BAP39422.1 hypothetical protein MCAN360_0171 [Metamycoplasma canadense]